MLSDDVRRRLESLNRQPLPPGELAAVAGSIQVPNKPFRKSPVDISTRSTPHGTSSSRLVAHEKLIAHLQRIAADTTRSSENGRQTETVTDRPAAKDSAQERSDVRTPFGTHLLIRQPLESLWPSAASYLNRKPETSATDTLAEKLDRRALRQQMELMTLSRHFPDRVVFLDLETCGFAGSTIFLAGLLRVADGRIVLDQLWARNYAEECALLHSLWTCMQTAVVLVSFNGKSFDWPQVHDRSTMHRLGMRRASSARSAGSKAAKQSWKEPTFVRSVHGPVYLTRQTIRQEPLHVDLLHHARRRWASRLPNCRLQTLERYVCGRHRTGDIPGHAIPDVYHDYVRTQNETSVQSILHHNALDLVTLLQLSLALLPSRQEPT